MFTTVFPIRFKEDSDMFMRRPSFRLTLEVQEDVLGHRLATGRQFHYMESAQFHCCWSSISLHCYWPSIPSMAMSIDRYMAPEVYRRESSGKSVDVFSLALIVHEGGPSNREEPPEHVADKRAYEDSRPPLSSYLYPELVRNLTWILEIVLQQKEQVVVSKDIESDHNSGSSFL